jgi:hypothetical protein
MLDNLRMESARITMSLIPHETSPENCVDALDGKFYPLANEFIYLSTKITNLSRRSSVIYSHINSLNDPYDLAFPLVFLMDLEMEPSDHAIHEGVLSDVGVGRLQSGESREVQTAICFLTSGRFELSADVRILEPSGNVARAGTGHLVAIVKAGSAA